MPDETQQGQQGTGEGNAPESGGKYNPASLEDAQKIIAALEKRLSEREDTITGLKSAQSTLAQQVQAIQDAQKKKLEEDGNYAELAKQRAAEIAALKPVADRAAALEAIIREGNEARVKALPETVRGLVPVDYAPERLQAWLNANETLLKKPPAANYDAGAGAGAGTRATTTLVELTDFEKQMAAASGMSPQEYAEFKQKKGAPIEIKSGADKEK